MSFHEQHTDQNIRLKNTPEVCYNTLQRRVRYGAHSGCKNASLPFKDMHEVHAKFKDKRAPRCPPYRLDSWRLYHQLNESFRCTNQ
uniref:Uncharacterized protein n=1 Tax=Ascaris lumbricoides TaxID=6252 RepID=A0A0M3HXE2_ASCLU